MILSYIFFNYIFSVFYIFLSHVDNRSFSTGGPLSIIDGIFFSVVTATTIGYGDVYPETGIAKLSVLFQILISMFYAVVLFSASSSYLRDYVSTVKKQAAKEVAEELEQKTEQSAQG
nr:potassium channel family protein [Acetobacter thailandicus]